MENIQQNKFRANFFKVIKGISISLFTTLGLLFIFAILLTYTNITESIIPSVIIIISGISILIGSSISTIKIKKNGLINGGVVGLIYILSIYILSSIINGTFSLNSYSIIMIIISVVVGMIGGIIGINLK